MNLFKKYFWDIIKNHYTDFKGRATRKQYWLFVLVSLIIIAITFFFIGLFYAAHLAFLSGVLLGLYIIYVLAIIVPGLALAVRRLHDIGQSGWWYLLILVPWVGAISLLILYCIPSQKGENKWGANPYGK